MGLTIIKKTGKTKHLIEINSIDDFIKWLNFEFKPVHEYIRPRSIDLHNKVNSMIMNNEIMSTTSFRKIVRGYMVKCEFPVKLDYWKNRGYSLEEAALKITDHQAMASKKYAEKRKANPEKYAKSTNTKLEFWLNKGLSIDEAQQKLAERQRTFSLQTCIEKYGEIDGKKVFENRQNRWKESLSKSINIMWTNKDKGGDGSSNKSLIDKHGDNWLLVKLNLLNERPRIKKKTLDFIKHIHTLVYEDRIDLLEYIGKLDFDQLSTYTKSSIVQTILCMNSTQIKSKWCEANNIKFKKSTHGNLYWFNGYFCKSNNEFKITKLLLELGLEFEVNCNYPNSKRAYDFYIPSLNLYIEWLGMRTADYSTKRKDETLSQYNIIWTNSFKTLKSTIYEKIYKFNNN